MGKCSPGSTFVLKNEIISLLKGLKMDTVEYMKKDPSLSNPLLLLVHAGYHSMIFYRFYHFFYKLKIYPISYLLYYLSRILFSTDIHPAAEIEPGVVIDHAIGTVIGSTAVIGTGTLIYHGVTLGARKLTNGKRHPDVGRNVVIGAGAKVLGSIKIGDFAKIGANSVVLDDVPEGATVVGIPARVVKMSSEIPETGVRLNGDDPRESHFSDLQSSSDIRTR